MSISPVTLRLWMLLVVLSMPHIVSAIEEPLDIGSRRELFVDRALVDSLDGVTLEVQRPEPAEVVLTTDAPWEGNTCAYYTLLQDGDRYRMYYRASHYDTATRRATHPEFTCYAESRDGIHWTKPNLGLYEFDGSRDNNIVWQGIGTHCFTPFVDTRPDCPADARYKAIARGRPQAKAGLYTFKSPDGIHWTQMQAEPVITVGAFDSQNLAFWDSQRRCYVSYHRGFNQGVRDILTCTSDDFVKWTKPQYLTYPDAPREHLYTNAIRRYSRAPQLLLGFPTRFQPRTQQVEPVLMSSRDGKTFHRWDHALIPIDAPKDRDGNRSNYMTYGLLDLPTEPDHLSVYATEAYYTGPDSRVRRFRYRKDGFVAARAEGRGSLTTRPFVFEGDVLRVNFEPGNKGRLRVELQSIDGKPIEGFSFDDAVPLDQDTLDGVVTWKGDAKLNALAGKPIRMKIELDNAKLFAFRFGPR